jgi:dTMP kinase
MLLRKTDESPVPRCELLLYEAARSQHVERVIRPQLEAGHWVLCDRFTASTVAFQAAGRGLMPRQIQWLNEFAVAGVSPQLNILLDVTIEQSQRRRADRYGRQGGEEDRFESENQNFHRKVRESYLHQAQQDPEKWLIIEGSRSPEDIGEEIWRRLGVGGWLES